MKAVLLVVLLIFSLLIACKENRPPEISYAMGADSLLSLDFPVLIEGGNKVVYKIGKMTPRGMRFYLDTIENKESRMILRDSVR
jgi:hypothetical protein